ncbi:hypothetical protein BI032_gp206 [Citrobacter phage vB_CfrM_CfP1]|uniref:Uncharacterized protein n=1 Tax=Citrobacter phage vB_CfrM_CfP1 TaxID=1871313 RepID=A0A1B1IXX0_9CAUD|nr:hypothetical protein BI032_gp206 [Citrobacter phage vB_CfrM_CfP1]ANS06163.1 hypothetical protein ABCD_0143 [Citrobacter phage vB_CfrM_CfP1]
MRHQEEKVLKHKLKELGELYQDYAAEDDPDSRNLNMTYINNMVDDIIAFVEKEVEDAVEDAIAEERSKHG